MLRLNRRFTTSNPKTTVPLLLEALRTAVNPESERWSRLGAALPAP